MKKLMMLLLILMSHVSIVYSAENDEKCSAMPAIAYEGKLPKTINEQKKATKQVPTEKVIMGDIVFFKGIERFGCPEGITGMVSEVRPSAIVFMTMAAIPREQVILLPSKTNKKGNFWYDLVPEFRTLNPKTDPPRPGDKNYKLNRPVER